MTKTKFGLIIIILLLVLVLILSKCNKKTPNINNVSLPITQNIVPAQKPTKQEKITDNKNATMPIETNSNNDSLIIDPELSYLKAFRQYTFFALCADIVNDFEQDKNPLDSFRLKVERNKKFGYAGGEDHENYFLEHVENCKGHLESDDETFEEAYARFKTTYQNIKPKTEEEIELAKNISLFENVNDLKRQIDNAEKGSSSLSPKAIDQLHLELEKINNIIAPLLSLSESDRTIEESNQITYYINKRRSLFNKIRNSNLKDDELIKSLLNEYNDNLNLLIETITNIKSADIYALMIQRNNNRFVNNLYSHHIYIISKHSKNKTPFKDIYYPSLLTRATLPLFACALEYPCAEDSQITLFHCIYMANKNACGRSVEDFYLNYYISPNMQQDLNIFLNYLFEYYAKD